MDKFDGKKFEKDLKKNVGKLADKANAAAGRENTPEAQARAFKREMKRGGVDINEKELRKKFRGK